MNPVWLSDSHVDYVGADKSDGGATWRSAMVKEALLEFFSSRRGPWLDYGSGSGHLSRMLSSSGVEMLNYDPYRGVDQSGEGKFSVISCIETVEHVSNPTALISEISRRLDDDGVLVMSTCLRVTGVHGEAWSYLAPEFGQHVTLMTEAGLASAARAAGMVALGRLVCLENEELQLHVLAMDHVIVRLSNAGSFRWEPYLNSIL
jgi:SAM-dependent methyltransferase